MHHRSTHKARLVLAFLVCGVLGFAPVAMAGSETCQPGGTVDGTADGVLRPPHRKGKPHPTGPCVDGAPKPQRRNRSIAATPAEPVPTPTK